MLKCPACGRTGGPFSLRHQIQSDNQVIRHWGCPCSHGFYAVAGAERASTAQSLYTGFTIEHNGRSHNIFIRQINKHETHWSLGPWNIVVAGPPDGPGTRVISLLGDGETPLAEWRLQPGWGPSEVSRRLRLSPPPADLSPDLLARVLVRLMD